MILHKLGDASKFHSNNRIIAHICNDIGKWGKGFVLPLAKRYPIAKHTYLSDYSRGLAILGNITLIKVDDGEKYICNMFAQHGIANKYNMMPIDYDALASCLYKLAELAIATKCDIQMPKIGSGLAGGDWNTIEKIISKNVCDFANVTYNTQLNVHIYSLNKQTN